MQRWGKKIKKCELEKVGGKYHACDKTMSWEYFRNRHVPTVHNGKKVPVKVISRAEAPAGSSTQSVVIRNLFASSLTAVSIQI